MPHSAPLTGNDHGPPKYQLFCVHKLLFALRSPVFFDLFADANVDAHTSNAPSTQGHPTRLIKQVYDDWPTTLHKWDVHQAEIHAMWEMLPPSGHHAVNRDRPYSDVLREPESTIIFPQDIGCPEILPPTFYRLLAIDIDITDDWILRDPSPAHPSPLNLSLSSLEHARLARRGLLSKPSLMRYIPGVRAAERERTPHTKMFISDGCRPLDEVPQASGTPCLLYVKRVLQINGARDWDSGRGGRERRDSLRWLTDCMEHDLFPALSKKYFLAGLCTECIAALFRAVPREW
ncbi:hypothetical protein V8D89_000998 [Ganoderma adspersum]